MTNGPFIVDLAINILMFHGYASLCLVLTIFLGVPNFDPEPYSYLIYIYKWNQWTFTVMNIYSSGIFIYIVTSYIVI